MSDTLAWGPWIHSSPPWMSSLRGTAIEVETSLSEGQVVQVLERLVVERDALGEIVLDNGLELAGIIIDQWVHERGSWLRIIEPDKPIQNAVVESTQRRLRDECLDRHWVVGLHDARPAVELSWQDYNRLRP